MITNPNFRIPIHVNLLKKTGTIKLTVVNTMYMDVNNRLYSYSKTVWSRVPQRDVGS